ncbi:MAG: glutathione S-transferase family protein [Acidiferrobacterales bacterium]|nr:glutathione S-transferase family protein [Acidiferrobacterales bacterium]
MLKLFGLYPSRSNRVQWALEESGAPYEFYHLDFAAGESKSPEFLALNPGGKIPVLQDGELVLTESGAICSYLGDKFPDTGLTPAAGTEERAKYDQWMFFVQSELEQPMWTKAKHKFAIPKKYRVEGLGATVEWEFQQALAVLSGGIGDKQCILGDQFTMADIMICHTLGWARIANFEIEQSNVVSYMERQLARPAVARMADKERRPLGS